MRQCVRRGCSHGGSAVRFATVVLVGAFSLAGAEWHVSTGGDDGNPGTRRRPVRTIQRGAELAQPGDTVTVHGGVYRERVNPPRGGASERRRIVYRAAPGERVEIKGSERVQGWVKVAGGGEAWKATVPNGWFGGFNPFTNVIRGDWFDPRGRPHHTGAVYLDGEWLTEAATLEEVVAAGGAERRLWFARVEGEGTTVWARFPGVDPNERLVEINVRQTVFYPDQPGRNYITVRGFEMRQAATPWAPPTAEQVGLIGTHWSKGWIIEGNVISHSVCSGISLGKHGDAFDNTSADTAEGYVKTIERAHAFWIPWTREAIGHHVVRNNVISHCEQAGIVGSLGGAFSRVEGNEIHDVHVRRLFSGAEMAGIKLHGAIDTVIRGNRIFRCCQGLWLDWMAQGTRVTGNLFHDNADRDLFLEVNHGPFLVDNNLFLSAESVLDVSEGGAFAHNLFAGRIRSAPEPNRETPYHPAHSTAVAGLVPTQGGDHRFLLNVFVGNGAGRGAETRNGVGYGLSVYDERPLPLQTGGNVFYRGARPYGREERAVVELEHDPAIELFRGADQVELRMTWRWPADRLRVPMVTTEALGLARISGVPYEGADGEPLRLEADYHGRKRSRTGPTPGPFEGMTTGERGVAVWPGGGR